jgi:flotillin
LEAEMTPGAIGVLIAVAAVIVMAVLIFIKTNLIICPPNEVLIFSGRKRKLADGSVVGYRAVRGGRGFRLPFIESVSRMALNTMAIDVSLEKALTAGVIPITIEGIATVKIAGSEAQGLSNAIERFLGRNPHEISTVARQIVEGSLRGVLATMEPEEANANRLDLARRAAEAASEDLGKLGLVLDTLQIQNLYDEQGYLEAIGRKRNAEVLRNARIAEADAEAEARKVAATAKRDASVAEAEAETLVVEAENGLRVKRAELAVKANQAEERATVAREIARVDEERRLEELRVELNRSKYEAEKVIPARAEKEAEELRAQGNAARILEDGKATAEAMSLLREQWKSDESRDIMLLQMLPGLLDRVTSVLSENLHIERLTVLDGGDGGLPNHVRGLTGSIVAVLEQLKNATGVDVAGILRERANGKREEFPKQLG